MNWSVCQLSYSEYLTYLTWFSDEELARRISLGPDWYRYVTETPGAFAWMAKLDGEPAAVVQFGVYPHPSFSISMNPALRGRGFCRAVIWLIFEQPELRAFNTIYGYIEPDNVASLNCVRGIPGTHISDTLDADGMIEATFSRAEALSGRP